MSAVPKPRLTAEEYLVLDRAAQIRSEYVFAPPSIDARRALGELYDGVKPLAAAGA